MANGLFQVFVFFCSAHSVYGAKLPIADLNFLNCVQIFTNALYRSVCKILFLESICDQVTFRPKDSSHSIIQANVSPESPLNHFAPSRFAPMIVSPNLYTIL